MATKRLCGELLLNVARISPSNGVFNGRFE